MEEDAFIKKKRVRHEELEEVMEKRKWEKYKAEHRRIFLTIHIPTHRLNIADH